MAISFTFKDLLDSVGFSGQQGTGGPSLSKSKELIKNPTIRTNIVEKLKKEYVEPQNLSNFFINVRDTDLKNRIKAHFDDFFKTVEQGTGDSTKNPLLLGDNAAQGTDSLVALLKGIKDDMMQQSKSGVDKDPSDLTPAKVTPSGAQLNFNATRIVFTLSQEDTAALDEVTLAALSDAPGEASNKLIIPRNAVFMSDPALEKNYEFQRYPTFTGIDITPVFLTPHITFKAMTIKVLSYSMHSGLIPVGILGRDSTKGFAKGDRSIAGSMICTITLNDAFMEMQPVLYTSDNNYAKSNADWLRTYLLPDQFPVFDVILFFTNEYGFNAAFSIFGIKFTDMGSAISMTDSEIEVTYTYMALDMDVIRNIKTEVDEDGVTRRFDPLENNEYLAKRERILKGESEHRSIFEVPSMFAAVDRRAREIAFNRLQNTGLALRDIVNFKEKLGDFD